jgi:hypothetical protein
MAGIALTAQRIRLAIDASVPFQNSGKDAITANAIALPSGSALNFELLFYFQELIDANLLDLTQYTQINLALCANADPHSGTIYYEASIAEASFNTGCTVENWNTDTAANSQVQFFVPSAANVVPAGNTNYWLVIYAVSADGAADDVLLYAGKITGQDSGIPAAAGANAGSPTKVGSKLSFVCSWDNQTRDLTLVETPNGLVSYQIGAPYNGPGQASYAMQLNGGLYYNLSLILENGQATLDVSQNGHS